MLYPGDGSTLTESINSSSSSFSVFNSNLGCDCTIDLISSTPSFYTLALGECKTIGADGESDMTTTCTN